MFSRRLRGLRRFNPRNLRLKLLDLQVNRLVAARSSIDAVAMGLWPLTAEIVGAIGALVCSAERFSRLGEAA